MFIAITNLFTFRFAQIRLRTWKFFRMLSAPAFLLDNLQTLTTFASVTAFGTNMIATFECLQTGVPTRADIFSARRL